MKIMDKKFCLFDDHYNIEISTITERKEFIIEINGNEDIDAESILLSADEFQQFVAECKVLLDFMVNGVQP